MKYIAGLFILTGVLFAYQNCGEIKLSPAPVIQQASQSPVAHSVDLDLCLKSPDNLMYDLDASPLIVNLNAIPQNGIFLADTDADGIADENEKMPFLPNTPRSQGSLLDIICYKSGTCPSSCSD